MESIADIIVVHENSISNVIDSHKKGHLSKIVADFKPLLYNIWNLPKQDKRLPVFNPSTRTPETFKIWITPAAGYLFV